MLFDILPPELQRAIKNRYNESKIFELRIKVGKPILVNNFGLVTKLVDLHGNYYYATRSLVDYIIMKATNISLYKYNEQLKQGFISVDGGIRIGIAGEVVLNEKNEVKTIKNFSSLVISVPHQVCGCADKLIDFVMDSKGIKNCLIISPPGCGKTTLLRDIARQISMNEENLFNVLIIDERFEIGACEDGLNQLDIGNCDILSGATKKFGFYESVRVLRPNVIITDELSSTEDLLSIISASSCGVKVIASMHGNNHFDLKKKPFFCDLFKHKIFERYIILSNTMGVGTVEAILDESFELIRGPL